MASSKEMHHPSRPLAHQRPALSSSASSSGLPGRQAHARTGSHSLVAGAFNPSHRVTRRKSVTNNSGHNVAALTAAVANNNNNNNNADHSPAMPIAAAARRNTPPSSSPPSSSSAAAAAAAAKARAGCLPSPPASLPTHKTIPDVKESAIDDEANDLSADEGLDKTRVRRASDGQPLLKDGKKSNRIEVRCDKCGKGYKHSSCLTKHLWEHTPEWSYTSKLLISKHQQVQLLEAASVLVAMNGKESSATTPPDSTKDSASEPDSASPADSAYSESGDRQSSADTTPPPAIEGFGFGASSYHDVFDGGAGHFSPLYRPTAQVPSFLSDAALDRPAFGHVRQPSHERRPPSSGANRTGEDDRDLAAAVELLSCSFGSNNGSHGTVTLLSDVPPVPPLPARYLDQATSLTSAGFINSFPSRQPESFTRGELRRDSIDVKMEDSGDDDDFDMRSRARSDEDDDGVFGRMEE